MTKNIRSGGVDFDDLFDPDIMGDGPSTSWLTSGGTPLKYAALMYGTKRADVGYRNSAGVDVTNLWAAKNTAVYSIVGLNGRAFDVDSTTSAQFILTLFTDGTWLVNASGGGGAISVPPPTSGTWLPPASVVGDWEVQFAATRAGTPIPAETNGAAAYSSFSANRTYEVGYATGPAERSGSADLTIRLRKISTGVVQTTTLAITLTTEGIS